MMGFHPIGSVTPTLTLPRQGGGNYLETQINPPSPSGRGLGGGGSEPLNLDDKNVRCEICVGGTSTL
jgi:hypothetical protein